MFGRVIRRSVQFRGPGVRSQFLLRSGPTFMRHFSTPVVVPLPDLGDSISEGTLLEWTKAVGDHVALDEVVAVVETDKVSVDITAPSAGVIQAFNVEEGATVFVKDSLYTFLPSEEGSAPPASSSKPVSGSTNDAPAPPPPPAAAPTQDATPKPEEHHARTPMIQFRHGVREAPRVPATGPAPTSTSTAAHTLAAEPVALEFGARPGNRVISQYEIDLIEMGGAEPY